MLKCCCASPNEFGDPGDSTVHITVQNAAAEEPCDDLKPNELNGMNGMKLADQQRNAAEKEAQEKAVEEAARAAAAAKNAQDAARQSTQSASEYEAEEKRNKAREEEMAKKEMLEVEVARKAVEEAAQAQKPQSEAASRAGLSITFTEGAESYVRLLTSKPVGIDLRKTMPMVVSKSTGHAATQGVKQGWKITEIGGKPVNDNMTFNEAFGIFKTMVDEKIPSGLNIVFSTASGEVKSLYFSKRPLGIDFARSLPITVDKVTDQGIALGVQRGWKIIEIAGEQITDSMTFEQAFELVKRKVATLP